MSSPETKPKESQKIDLHVKIPIWPTGYQPERQKEKGSRQDKTVTSVILSLLKPDWPGYVLLTDVPLNSEAKHMTEVEWRLIAAGNHEELKTCSRNSAVSSSNTKSHITNLLPEGCLFLGTFSEWRLPKGRNIQHLNSMANLLSL